MTHIAALAALLGADAAADFKAAIHRDQRLDCRPWLARACERYAGVLGDSPRAAELLTRAAADGLKRQHREEDHRQQPAATISKEVLRDRSRCGGARHRRAPIG